MDYIERFKEELETAELTPKLVARMMENTNFFLKILRVKFESGNPELIQQGMEDLKQMKEFLISIESNKNPSN